MATDDSVSDYQLRTNRFSEIGRWLGLACAVAGGFSFGGVGGAILLAPVGFILGAFLGAIAEDAFFSLLLVLGVVAVLGGFLALVAGLWGVGV